MFCIDNVTKAKKSARALEKFFAKSGTELVHGHALNAVAAIAGFTDWNAMNSAFANRQPAQADGTAPSILDIDFAKVSSLNVYGSEYHFSAEDDVLHTLRFGGKDERAKLSLNETVLELQSLNDEVYADETMTVGELLDYKWNSAEQCFVNSQGRRFTAYVTKPYEFASAGAALSAPCGNATGSPTKDEVPQRYEVSVYIGGDLLGEKRYVARSESAAYEAGMDDFWDERLERSLADVTVELMDDEQDGPFSVRIDGVSDFSYDGFAQAYAFAEELAEALSPKRRTVEILDFDDQLVIAFNKVS